MTSLATANYPEGPQKVKAPKIASRIELEKRLAGLNRRHYQPGQRAEQLRDLRRNKVIGKTSINNKPLYAIETSATRGLDQVPHRFLKPIGGRFHRRMSRYGVGLLNRLQATACRIENEARCLRATLQTLEIERSER
jgi:hypothetical protein